MLDRRFVVENLQRVKQNCVDRGAHCNVDEVVELEAKRRAAQVEADELNRRANEVSKSIGKAKDAAEREARKEEGRQLRERCAAAQTELDRVGEQLDCLLRAIPNMTHPDAPVGMEPREVARGKTVPRQLDFKPLDHVEIAEKLGLVDFEAAARVTGHGFYFLKNDCVLLELALVRYAMEICMQEGFTLTTTPDLARNDILEGIGFMPRGPETQIYSVENSNLSLVATAEITLGGMLAGQVLEAEQLPLKICGISHCFRTEAGAHGRATRGLFRVHQFTKVEMFAFTLPDQSEATLEYLRGIECRIFDGLGIPYRVIDTPTGDLGGPAYRKYDLEAWMPGRNEFGEVTSTSNCTDYQAPPPEYALSPQGREGNALRPHAQRHRRGRGPRAGGHSGKLPTGRRLGRRARGAAALGGARPDRSPAGLTFGRPAPICNRILAQPLARARIIPPVQVVLQPRVGVERTRGVEEERVDRRVALGRDVAKGIVLQVIHDGGRVGARVVLGQVLHRVLVVRQSPEHVLRPAVIHRLLGQEFIHRRTPEIAVAQVRCRGATRARVHEVQRHLVAVVGQHPAGIGRAVAIGVQHFTESRR